jgi:NAD(P)-dependent dehydrogenase (short-subunit alcohol dehydrogenase family)
VALALLSPKDSFNMSYRKLLSLTTGDLSTGFRDKEIVFKKVDVTDATGLNLAVQEVVGSLGDIHVLATFAGIVNAVRATDYTVGDFSKIIEVNITGAFLTAQAVGR